MSEIKLPLGRVHISTEAERQYREAGEPVGPGIWHEGFKRGFTYALSLRDAEQPEDSVLLMEIENFHEEHCDKLHKVLPNGECGDGTSCLGCRIQHIIFEARYCTQQALGDTTDLEKRIVALIGDYENTPSLAQHIIAEVRRG